MKTRVLAANPENVVEAAKAVKEGRLVVFPTDTVYGLGCDPFNVPAVERLVRTKGGRDKPFPILAQSISDVERIAELSGEARTFAEKYWPGPLTLVLRRKNLPDTVTRGSATVGVRIPNHVVALMLLRLAGGLLIGTSANKSGVPPPSSALEAYAQLKGEVDLILDGGSTGSGNPSTILELTGNKPKILRAGALDIRDL